MKIGEALCLIRDRAGLSREELARRLGSAVSTVQAREKGDNTNWSTIMKWLDACDSNVYDLAEVFDPDPVPKVAPRKLRLKDWDAPAPLEHGELPEPIDEEIPEGLVLVFEGDNYRLGEIKEVAGKVCLVDEKNQLIFSGPTYEDVLAQIPEEVDVYERRPV